MQVRWLVPLTAVAAPQAQIAYAAQYMTVEQAQQAAFPGATAFVPFAADAGKLAQPGAPPGWAPKIWQARAAGKDLGWLLVDQVVGKSEMITYAVALDAAGAIASVEVLDYREAHGGEVRLAGWRKQFVGKTGADPVELNRDIRNISGATLSCRHITEGVQRLLKVYNAALRGGGK